MLARFLKWMTTHKDRSIVVIVLIIIAVFVLVVVGVSILTNNPVLTTVAGVIIGATFAIIGNIINVTWLDPVKRKQDREEKELDRKQDRSDRKKERERERCETEAKLRKALYGELISIAESIGPEIQAQMTLSVKGDISYLRSNNKSKHLDPLSFRVFKYLITDPVAFYQLEDASNIDFAYGRLKRVYNALTEFLKTQFVNASEAQAQCVKLIGLYKFAVSAVDVVFDAHKDILKDLDNGRFISAWDELKGIVVGIFGPLEAKRGFVK